MTTRSNFGVVAQEMNGHQRRRRETRRVLLEAARELFIERGVEATSIDAITARAGVAKGSFYNHFESRDVLFEDLLESILQQLIERYLGTDLFAPYRYEGSDKISS